MLDGTTIKKFYIKSTPMELRQIIFVNKPCYALNM